MDIPQLRPGAIVRGPVFPEAVEVIATFPMGDSLKLVGRGLESNQVREVLADAAVLADLTVSPEVQAFDGDPYLFRLGVEAMRLALAYEYDPYFSLSIARVDPLPHQLEAVYDYFLRLPRIRFLLADDPGAGKTIMAGLLLKELKARGLVRRTLIVTPANLSFQWQRELRDKFRESFEVVRGDVLRANYGSNPFQDRDQLITSISWVSRIDDARESLMRSQWDLIIVDEAHKMSAYSREKKTLAYRLGEDLSERTDHLLLMTATPHKGDPANFCLFLELLDRDVYGDVKSLEEAMKRNEAPFYLRRTKETLITFPDPETGLPRKIFTNREVQTVDFQIDDEEWDFYDGLTRYVEDQSIKALADQSARGRALGFTMAMLQRRFASSLRAVRRSLERMRARREKILEDPEAYRQEQIAKGLPEDYDELTDEEQQWVLESLEAVVASVDPAALREEIIQLTKLIDHALVLEKREIESKLTRLRSVLTEHGIFDNPQTKLLIFTEHKDTLDYLVEKLTEWGLTVTQIHGGMKIGNRDETGTRLWAEREFRDNAQVMVATEAAGEGINLQFCWFMINYDIPWNPVRLEQRMGRIHRYGQEHDCLILNFVATNTREGRVLQRLLERLREIRSELGTDHVFDVVGEVFPSNSLERMFRDLYARKANLPDLEDRIVRDIDPDRFRAITESALESLVKRDLNLSALVGRSTEAKEGRLIPEVIEDFFLQAAPTAGIQAREIKKGSQLYRVGRVPRTLWRIGERQEVRFGRLGREYRKIGFDKERLAQDPTAEWVTPGHPLFEAVRAHVEDLAREHLQRGAVFYDLNADEEYSLDLFAASIRDGLGEAVHRRLFAVKGGKDGFEVTRPTVLLDLTPAKDPNELGQWAGPTRSGAESTLVEDALRPLLAEATAEREKAVATISRHIDISLKELIHRQNVRLAELLDQDGAGKTPLNAANIRQTEDRIDELNARLEHRLEQLEKERRLSVGEISHIGCARVIPHPERKSPGIAPMVRDEEIEQIAVAEAMRYETERGWSVESVEKENRGFDLISRKPHPEDPETFIAVRFIEVKGRAGVGEVGLTSNEFKTAERLKDDYWLYVAFNCGTTPELHTIQDPARLHWEAVVTVEHYRTDSSEILEAG